GRECTVIEILAENERPQQLRQIFTGTGDDAPLDPGIALPLASLVLIILLEQGEAAGERTFRTVGTQPHVDAEHETVLGEFVDGRDQLLAEPREKFVVAQRLAGLVALPPRFAVLFKREDEIDVGGGVELLAA